MTDVSIESSCTIRHMVDLFDTSQIRDDANYWNDLATRVVDDVKRDAASSSLAWLARPRAIVIAASLLVAAALAISMLSRTPSSSRDVQWTEALAPNDDVGKTIAVRDGPPPIGALLLGGDGPR